MTVPTIIATYGTVTGRFITASADGPDGDSLPDATPATGTVTFTPNIEYVRTRTAGLKTIMVPKPVVCQIDLDGYLISPGNPAQRSVTLIASDSESAIQPTGWTYTVAIRLTGSLSIAPFAIQVLAAGTIDLADIVPTPAAPLVSVPNAVSLAAEAQASALAAQMAAEAAAASVAGGGGGTSTPTAANLEEVRDMLAVTLVGGTRMTVTPNDATDTITFATTATTNDTDANLRARASHTGTQTADTLTDGATNKVFLGSERSKLAGVATGATANDTDANLRARSSHTGTQAISTITGLQAALDNAGAPGGVSSGLISLSAYSPTADGVTDTTAAFTSAINAAAALTKPGMKLQNGSGTFQGGTAANGGATIYVPAGVYVVSNLVLRHRVTLWLDSGAILLQKAASTGPVITNRRDTTEHAQYCGVIGGTIHGNKTAQTAANHGVHWQGDTTSNFTSVLDEDYDINCFVINTYVMQTKGNGVHMTGAGANRIVNVKVRGADGVGIYSFQDNHIDNCDIGWSGTYGVHIDGESCTVTNTKSWYSGQVTAANGHGFYLTADSGAMSGCNAQDNRAAGFCWDGAFGWSASALLSDSNSRGSAGTYPAYDFYASNFNQVAGVARNRYNASANGTTVVGEQASAVRLRNSSIGNTVTLTAAVGVWGQSDTFLQSGSTATGNWIVVNGQAVAGGGAGGTVTTKADIGLGNVDNTSDANKPVSTLQRTAIDGIAAIDYNGTAWPTSRPAAWGTSVGVFRSTKTVGAPTPPAWSIDGDFWIRHPDDAA